MLPIWKHNVDVVQEDYYEKYDYDEGPGFLIDNIYMVDTGSDECDWIEPLNINTAIIPCKLDTGSGAQANIIFRERLEKLIR